MNPENESIGVNGTISVNGLTLFQWVKMTNKMEIRGILGKSHQ
jgi:hypothetical protein